LTLFADGYSALFTGIGLYSPLPNLGAIPFSIYVVADPDNGFSMHFRLSDNSGNILFDSSPCQAPIVNITDQPTLPFTEIGPNSILDIFNPVKSTVSALTEEGQGVAAMASLGLVIGISVGLLVFIVIAVVIVFLLLRREQASVSATSNDKFVTM